MIWRWPWKKDVVVTERPSTPELTRVRQLAQKAAELGAQVERELAQHKIEGHPQSGQ